MHELREALGVCYLALAEAFGGQQMLDAANSIIGEVIDRGDVDDPAARCVLESLVHSCRHEVA